MRQSQDPEFAATLHRLRIHQPTLEDIELLNSRVCAPLHSSTNIPIVVRRHQLRNGINSSKLHEQSDKSGIPLTHCLAQITKRSNLSLPQAYQLIYRLKGGARKLKADGILSLIPGAPLVINEKIDSSLGIVSSLPYTNPQALSTVLSLNFMDLRIKTASLLTMKSSKHFLPTC